MEKILGNLKFSIAFGIVRFISLSCLCFSTFWIFSDHEFSDEFLNGFPMFYVPFKNMLDSKRISVVLFPLIMNIALWASVKKAYPLLYGVFMVEKWKALFKAIGLMISIFLMMITYPNGSKQYLWSLLFSVGYFIVLHYFLKEMKRKNFLNHYMIEKRSERSERKCLMACLVYLLVVFGSVIEYNIQRSHIQTPLQASVSHRIENGYVTDVSSDQKRFVVNYSNDNKWEGTRKHIIGIYDVEMNALEEILCDENIIYGQYGRGDDQLFVQKVDDENKEGWLSVYHLSSNLLQELPRLARLNYKVSEISFSKNQTYLAAIGSIVAVWDTESGMLLKSYNDMRYDKNFMWLNDNDYIIIQKKIQEPSSKDAWIVEVGHINKNGDIETIRKEKMEEFLKDRMKELNHLNFFVREINEEKKVALVINGESVNGIMFYEGLVLSFSIDNEELNNLLNGNNKIIQFEISSDGKRMIMIEEMKVDHFRSERARMTFWNRETMHKEKTVVLDGLREGRNQNDIRILQNGDKVISLVEDFKIWKIN